MKNMMKQQPSIKEWIPRLFLALFLGVLYLLTIAPGLTWANNGADGGDFVAAAATWGVAHPPGYPVYLLVAMLFQQIPIGSIAFRTNLLSLISTIIAAIFVYEITVTTLKTQRFPWIFGMIAALSFGLSRLVWSQALITEVYALQELLFVMILYLLLGKNDRAVNHPEARNLQVGLLLGLSLGNHLTAVFLIIPVFSLDIFSLISRLPGNGQEKPAVTRWFQSIWVNWHVFASRLLGLLLGLSFYASLLMRANSGSPVNWGNPSNLGRFLDLVTGKIYQGYLSGFSNGFLSIKLNTWGTLIVDQVGIIGTLLGLLGLIACFRNLKRGTFLTLWIALCFLGFSFVYNSVDSYVYLIFFVMVFSIWIGWGSAKIIENLSKFRSWLGIVFGIFIVGWFVYFGLFETYHRVDASQDTRAEDFGAKVMGTAPKDSIIITDGDRDTFALWYFHYVLKERPDLVIIARNLLTFEWYRHTIKTVYPFISVPDKTETSWIGELIEKNPDRNICSTIVVEQATMNCSQ